MANPKMLPEAKRLSEHRRLVLARESAKIVNQIYANGGSLTEDEVRRICLEIIRRFGNQH